MKADKHGGDIYSFAKKHKIVSEEVVNLSSNRHVRIAVKTKEVTKALKKALFA